MNTERITSFAKMISRVNNPKRAKALVENFYIALINESIDNLTQEDIKLAEDILGKYGFNPHRGKLMFKNFVKCFLDGTARLIISGSFHWNQRYNLRCALPGSYEYEKHSNESLRDSIEKGGKMNGTVSLREWIQLMHLKACYGHGAPTRFINFLRIECEESEKVQCKDILAEIREAWNIPAIPEDALISHHVLISNARYEDIVAFLKKEEIDFSVCPHEFSLYGLTQEEAAQLKENATFSVNITPRGIGNDRLMEFIK